MRYMESILTVMWRVKCYNLIVNDRYGFTKDENSGILVLGE